jgi:hypothetical protein
VYVYSDCAGAPSLAPSPPRAFPGTTTKSALPSQHRYIIFLHKHDVIHVVTECYTMRACRHHPPRSQLVLWAQLEENGGHVTRVGVFNLLADFVVG